MRPLAAVLAALAATSTPTKPPVQLFVTALNTRPGAAAETDVDLALSRPASAVTVFVPPGYSIDLGARAGTVIGTARTTVASTLVAAAAGRWTGTGLSVTVDRSSDGGYRLVCDLAQPTREVDLDIQQGLTNPPRGVVTWRATLEDGSEARSVVAFPQDLKLAAALTGGALRASGRLLFAGKPRGGVNVHLAVATRDDFRDAREVGTARTDSAGRYRLTGKVMRQRLLLIAYVNFYVVAGESIAPPPPQIVPVGPP